MEHLEQSVLQMMISHDEETLFMLMETFGQWDNLAYPITVDMQGGPEWYDEEDDWLEFKVGETSIN